MENPLIHGREYQNGPLKGYFDVREYVLERDGYACILCGSVKNRKLYRFRGKSNRPKNLVTLCGACHKKAVNKEIPFEVLRENYRWAARVNTMRALWEFSGRMTFITANQVAESRETLGFTKTHINDALAAIYAAFGVDSRPSDCTLHGRYIRQKNRQLHRANPGKGGVRQAANANRHLVSKASVRLRKGDLVECRAKIGRKIIGYINTLFSRGTVRIADYAGKELYNGASISKVRKLQDANSLVWEVNSGVSSPE